MISRRLLPKFQALPIFELAPNSAFRNWWVSSGVGQASVTLAPMALSWAVFQATDSNSWVGVVNGLPVFAIVPLTLVGGVLLDRVGRLKLFWQIHLALAAVFGGVAIIFASFPSVHPIFLIPVAAGIAAASSILVLASRLLITDIVDRDILANALSLSQLLRNVLVIIGPPVLGFVILIGSAGLFFGVLSTLHLGACLAAIRIGRLNTSVSQTTGSVVSDITEGLRYCKRTPAVGWLMAIGVMAAFANVYLPFLPFYARDVLDIGAGGFGLLIAAEGVGGVSGALLLGTVWKIRRKGMAVILTAFSYGLAMAVFGYSDSVALSLGALFLMGVSSAIWIPMMNACLQLVTEPGMRGRVVAAYSTIARIVRPLGFLLGGGLVLVGGTETAILIAALIQVFFNAFILIGVRPVRDIE